VPDVPRRSERQEITIDSPPHASVLPSDAPAVTQGNVPKGENMASETQPQSCIDDCTRCHAVCTETIQYCLEKSGKHAEEHHIRLMQDCVEICLAAADFMLRGSDLHPDTCGVCAEACERCARSCEEIGGKDDVPMKECAETCRRCANSCREMSKLGHKAA
jgi:hypothetical protein